MVMTVTSMHLELFPCQPVWLLSFFLVIERCGDVHKLIVVHICSRQLFCSWILAVFNLGSSV